jgi:apoptosis-inducing factor 3
LVHQFHESQGIKFHMKTKIEKIAEREDDPKLAGGVVVNGETIPADFVIMGVGVKPATEWLQNSGIPLQKDGSIQVDEYMHVQNLPSDAVGVFAIGIQRRKFYV